MKRKFDFAPKGKIIFTIFLLIGYRILAQIPSPGVNREYLSSIMDGTAALGFLNLVSGDSLENLSFMALSITPFITASIIIQLMEVVFPKLGDIRKDGKTGEIKYKRIEYLTTAGLSILQAGTMAYGFGRQGVLVAFKWYWVLGCAAFWILGAAVSVVCGEIITKKGIGNGISLILVTNILSSFPSDAKQVYEKCSGGSVAAAVLKCVIVLAVVFLLFAFVVLLQESEKTVTIIYASKLAGTRQANEIPLKLCPGSVVPIIFASTLMSIPSLVCYFTGITENAFVKFMSSSYWFNPSDMIYSIGFILYVALIFGFAFFYNMMVLNPHEIAENIRKGHGTIPGVRNGRPTADYIARQSKIMTFWGAVGLSIVAFVPIAAGGIFNLSSISFLGTSIIITVGVIVETKKTVQATTKVYAYKNKRIFA